jgi:hypothetical protein
MAAFYLQLLQAMLFTAVKLSASCPEIRLGDYFI